MKFICLIILLTMPSLSQAVQAHAVLFTNVSDGTVNYEYQVGLDVGELEAGYSDLKAIHWGKKDATFLHPEHTDLRELPAWPLVVTHSLPKAILSLKAGTHEYCSVLSPLSEVTGSGVEPIPIVVEPACEPVCYDLCTNC